MSKEWQAKQVSLVVANKYEVRFCEWRGAELLPFIRNVVSRKNYKCIHMFCHQTHGLIVTVQL